MQSPYQVISFISKKHLKTRSIVIAILFYVSVYLWKHSIFISFKDMRHDYFKISFHFPGTFINGYPGFD